MPLTAGTKLGTYEIVAPLGVGGMGEVYRAKDLELGRDVAIKVLRKEIASEPDALKRFEREARTASALNHPNITTIHHIGEHEGTRYIAMELVEGKTLRELLSEGPLATKKTLDVRDAGCRGPGQGSRRRHRPPGSEARELDGNRGRARKNPGLWTRQADPAGLRGRPRDGDGDESHTARNDSRDRAVHVAGALVHNSDGGRELSWPRLPSSDHLAIRHPERRHGVQNLAPDACLDSLRRQPSRSHR